MQKLLNLAGAKALRKNSKKGFTLVEIIVVIVIIAILLAALTPAVIGWINEARDRAEMAEARSVLIAAQAVVTEGITSAVDSAVIDGADDGTAGATGVVNYKGSREVELYKTLIGDDVISDSERLLSVEYDLTGNFSGLSYKAIRNTWEWSNETGTGVWTPKVNN